MDVNITLEADGTTALLTLASYQGSERFGIYRDICHAQGARYVPNLKANRLPVEATLAILSALHQAAFSVDVDPRLTSEISGRAAEAKQALEAGRARLEEVQERLKPTGLSLWRYQETGVEWLVGRRRALLADEMGLGKTVQALLALPDRAAALVVVPAAVRSAWASECRRWRPDLEPVTLQGKSSFRWPGPSQLVICTWGSLPPEEELPMPGETTYLMGDEAHAVKNPRAQRTTRFRALSRAVRDSRGYVWLITGTPLLNRPPELWAVLQSAGLGEEAFGSWYRFAMAFNGRKSGYGWEWGEASQDVPDRLRSVMLRRRRDEVLKDLPGKTRRDIQVTDLSEEARRLADEAWAMIEGKVDLAAALASAEATKIQGAAFQQLSAARRALAVAKIPTLISLVEEFEEQDEPLVVFSAHREPVEVVGDRHGWALITGSTPPDERGRLVEAFQRGELKGIAGTIGAMGVGVTLTHAHHLLLVDLAWTPALNSQAEDRVCRIGQDRGVIVHRLIADHRLDERVTELLTRKQIIIESAIEAAAVEEDCTGTSPAEDLARASEAARRAIEAGRKAAREEKPREPRRFREAANDQEAEAIAGLIRVAACDEDRARALNGVGFSKRDTDFGQSLVAQWKKYRKLSDAQWRAAVKLARRYRRQTGVA